MDRSNAYEINETALFGSRNLRKRQQEDLVELFRQLLQSKRVERQLESQLLKKIEHPLYKQWMDERIMDQYKHEKWLLDIAYRTFGQALDVEGPIPQIKVQSVPNELSRRLDSVVNNILFLNQMLGPIEDFKVYKILQSIINEEIIYQGRLILMIQHL